MSELRSAGIAFQSLTGAPSLNSWLRHPGGKEECRRTVDP
jgi:hypothetical protein